MPGREYPTEGGWLNVRDRRTSSLSEGACGPRRVREIKGNRVGIWGRDVLEKLLEGPAFDSYWLAPPPPLSKSHPQMEVARGWILRVEKKAADWPQLAAGGRGGGALDLTKIPEPNKI